jgi:hypothetical protein
VTSLHNPSDNGRTPRARKSCEYHPAGETWGCAFCAAANEGNPSHEQSRHKPTPAELLDFARAVASTGAAVLIVSDDLGAKRLGVTR